MQKVLSFSLYTKRVEESLGQLIAETKVALTVPTKKFGLLFAFRCRGPPPSFLRQIQARNPPKQIRQIIFPPSFLRKGNQKRSYRQVLDDVRKILT